MEGRRDVNRRMLVLLALAGLVTFVVNDVHGQGNQGTVAEKNAVDPKLAALTTIEEVDELAATYFSQDRIDQAIAAFEYAKTRFPADLYTTIRRLTSFYAMTKQFDKVMESWELGQSKGLFFKTGSKLFEPLFETERYRTFLAANQKLLDAARKSARATYDVVLPKAFDPAKEYPVFIVLHGNNVNTADIKPKWKLDSRAGDFILAFLQSSQVTGSESFVWDDQPTGRRDVAGYWDWLQANYKIDKKRVLIGGFSGGAGMAIDAAIRGVIPARAFIALCPGGVLPGQSDVPVAKEAAGRNLAGQVIAGEKDDPQEAEALVALLNGAGVKVGLTVIPGLGHAFPADLTARLEKAIGAVLEEE